MVHSFNMTEPLTAPDTLIICDPRRRSALDSASASPPHTSPLSPPSNVDESDDEDSDDVVASLRAAQRNTFPNSTANSTLPLTPQHNSTGDTHHQQQQQQQQQQQRRVPRALPSFCATSPSLDTEDATGPQTSTAASDEQNDAETASVKLPSSSTALRAAQSATASKPYHRTFETAEEYHRVMTEAFPPVPLAPLMKGASVPDPDAAPWFVENLPITTIRTLLIAASDPGEFIVNRNTELNNWTLWFNAPGLGPDEKLISARSKTNEDRIGCLERVDEANEEVFINWVDRQSVQSCAIPFQTLTEDSPRLKSHVASYEIHVHHDGSAEISTAAGRVEAPTVPDLIVILQDSGFSRRVFQLEGRIVTHHLKAQCICWDFSAELVHDPSHVRIADQAIPFTFGRKFSEYIYMGHWVQPGDFLVRMSDESVPEEKGAAFMISFMCAIRVRHKRINMADGLFFFESEPLSKFYLLSDLLDHVIAYSSIDGIPFRRYTNVTGSKVIVAEDTGLRRIPKFSRPASLSLWRGVGSNPDGTSDFTFNRVVLTCEFCGSIKSTCSCHVLREDGRHFDGYDRNSDRGSSRNSTSPVSSVTSDQGCCQPPKTTTRLYGVTSQQHQQFPYMNLGLAVVDDGADSSSNDGEEYNNAMQSLILRDSHTSNGSGSGSIVNKQPSHFKNGSLPPTTSTTSTSATPITLSSSSSSPTYYPASTRHGSSSSAQTPQMFRLPHSSASLGRPAERDSARRRGNDASLSRLRDRVNHSTQHHDPRRNRRMPNSSTAPLPFARNATTSNLSPAKNSMPFSTSTSSSSSSPRQRDSLRAHGFSLYGGKRKTASDQIPLAGNIHGETDSAMADEEEYFGMDAAPSASRLVDDMSGFPLQVPKSHSSPSSSGATARRTMHRANTSSSLNSSSSSSSSLVSSTHSPMLGRARTHSTPSPNHRRLSGSTASTAIRFTPFASRQQQQQQQPTLQPVQRRSVGNGFPRPSSLELARTKSPMADPVPRSSSAGLLKPSPILGSDGQSVQDEIDDVFS